MSGLVPWFNTNQLLNNHGHDNIREWHIWAAKGRTCPTCMAPPFEPCFNLAHVNKGEYPACNLGPHSERVDWIKLETYLRNVLGYR